MTTHTFYLDGPIQSGKTRLLLAILEGLERRGIPTCLIVDNEYQARWIKDYHVSNIPVFGIHRMFEVPFSEYRAIGIDVNDSKLLNQVYGDDLTILEFIDRRLLTCVGPTRIIITRVR